MNVQKHLEQLPDWLEFALVIGLAFGYFILRSIDQAFFEAADPSPISASQLVFLLSVETVLLLVVGLLLVVRKWTLVSFGLQLRTVDLRDGALLALLTLVVIAVVVSVVAVFGDVPPSNQSEVDASTLHSAIGVALIVAVSIINPIFEEVFVCGYVIEKVKQSWGRPQAIGVSVTIRLAYHLYAGPSGVLTIVTLGIIFASWFAKTRRLWPVIIAHGIIDFWSLYR